MGQFSRLGKNTLLVFIGKIGSGIIGFVMLPLYTRWLSVEEFGLSDILSVYSSFIVILATCCIGESLFIFPKGKSDNEKTKYFSSGMNFVFAIMGITACIFLSLQIIANAYEITNSFIDNIWFIYLLVISSSLQQLFQQFTRSIDKMTVFSTTGVVNTFGIALFAFAFIPFWRLSGYILSLVCANIVSGLYSFIASKSYKYLNLIYIKKEVLLSMLKYSVPLMPNGVMWWLVSSLNRPLMESHLGLNEIGIYAVAGKFPALLNMVFTIFSTSWQISVIEEFQTDNYKDFYNRVFKIIFVILSIVLVAISLFSKIFVRIFADADFYSAWKYIPILTIGALFSCLSSYVGANFSATRESKYFFYSSIWGAVVSVVLNLLLIPMFGLWGVCAAVVASFVAITICRLIYSWKYAPISMLYKYVILLLLSGLVVGSVTIELSYYIISFCVFAFFAYSIYLCKNEYRLICSLLSKKK